jgi:uncharacterized membrane protein
MPKADAARATRTGFASLGLALVGLAASIYLTIEHFTASTSLACPESATINCQKVTTSQWSHIGPVPVAVLGLVYFVAMSVLCTPTAWRHETLDNLRVIGAGIGVLTALYLVWIELFRINAICLWCSAVHACTLALLGAILWTTSSLRTSPHG